jgi:hypothetical protein
VGSLETRLARLEARSRERAAAQIARAWVQLTDEEVALLLAPYADGVRQPTLEERQIDERLRALVPEELIHKAIGFENGMEDEEVSHRISDLVGRLGIFERGSGIRRHLQATREGRR